MSSEFEYLPICSSPPILKYLSNACRTATSKRTLSSEIQTVLQQHNLLLQVKHLLMNDVKSKVQLYALCSKDIIKWPSKTATSFYYWNKNTCLWEMNEKNRLENVYLRRIVHNVYMTIATLVDAIPKNLLIQKISTSTKHVITKDKNISTLEHLFDCLLDIKSSCTAANKLHEISPVYIEYIVDPNFVNFLNPRGYMAVGENKIVNLRTGEIKDRTYKDYFTQEIQIKYDPNASSDLWNRVVDQTTLSNTEKSRFLQEFFGYCMTGQCDQGKLLMMIGPSRAGKSIFITLLDFILGDFATDIDSSLIVSTGKSSNAPDPFIAELKTKRLGIMNELQQTDVINTKKFKILVTNEKLPYRALYSNQIEKTTSQHVLILASNHKPTFPETDQSIWERLIIVRFEAKFVDNPKREGEFKIDRDLFSKLKNEKEAILKWLIDGAIRFYANGRLIIPEGSLGALDEYKMISEDENENYVRDRLEKTDNNKDRIKTVDLFNDYKKWCNDNGVTKLTKVPFGEFMSKMGFHVKKYGTNYYTHVKFIDDEDVADG